MDAPRPGPPEWVLDPLSRELSGPHGAVRLAEKPFRVLLALAEAEGTVVTRASLQQRLWSDDTFVDFDNNLNSAVATLRHVVGDSARHPRYIETIPKVGYRLVGTIRLRVPDAAAPPRDGMAVSSGGEVAAGTATRRWWHAVTAIAAGAVVMVLVGVLAMTGRSSPWRAADSTPRPETQAHLDRGRYLRARALTAPNASELWSEALTAFRDAGRLDPSSATPPAEEAETLVEAAFAGAVAFGEGLTRAKASAQQALALDAAQPVAQRAMGMASLFLDWDFPAADRWLRASLRRSPTSAKAWLARATWLAAAGHAAEAVEAAERAVTLDPEAYYVRADLAMFYLQAGRPGDAAGSSADVLRVAPDFVPALRQAVIAHAWLLDWEAAGAAARRLMALSGATVEEQARVARLDGRAAVDGWRQWELARLDADARADTGELALTLALRHAALGHRAAALTYLQDALVRQDALLVFIRAFPELQSLRGDPAFERLVAQVDAGTASRTVTSGHRVLVPPDPPPT